MKVLPVKALPLVKEESLASLVRKHSVTVEERMKKNILVAAAEAARGERHAVG